MAVWVFFMGLIVFIVVVVFWLRFGKQWPKCGGPYAIDTTGREERQPSFLERYLGEWKCRYGGHRMWQASDRRGGDRFADWGGNGGG